jgi:hypothetical protein
MTRFLEVYWERGGSNSEELAMLLGAMRTLRDGRPADPAMWSDWLAALSFVERD